MSAVEIDRVGLEDEGWAAVCNDPQRPADVASIMEDLMATAVGGKYSLEPGPGSIEYVGNPEPTVSAAVENIVALHANAQSRGLFVRYNHWSPFYGQEGKNVLTTPRYEALWKATQKEALSHGYTLEQWATIQLMRYRAALHVSVSVKGAEVRADNVDPRMIFLTNVISLVGPGVACALCRKYDQDNKGHLGLWHGWAQPGRFSRYGQWFKDFPDFRSHFQGLTRLIKQTDDPWEYSKSGAGWEPDLQTPLVWGNSSDEGSGWWPLCRLRSNYGTAEIRLLPSWPIQTLDAVTTDLVGFVVHVLSLAPSTPFEDCEEFMASREWTDLCDYRFEGGVRAIPMGWNETLWRQCAFN